MELSNDERTRMLYESRQKMEWDNKARERGAREKERIAIAKNLLNKQMPIGEIADVTGLTLEEVEDLQNLN